MQWSFLIVLCFSLSTSALPRDPMSFRGWNIPKSTQKSEFEILQDLRTTKTKTCEFGICENDPHYPSEKVLNYLKDKSNLESYFGTIVQPETPMFFRSDSDGEPFCHTREISKRPTSMVDVYGDEYTIVNVANYTQLIKFEICDTTRGTDCYAQEMLTYKTTCRQKYNEIKMVVYSENKADIYKIFRVPSACVCVYNRNQFI